MGQSIDRQYKTPHNAEINSKYLGPNEFGKDLVDLSCRSYT